MLHVVVLCINKIGDFKINTQDIPTAKRKKEKEKTSIETHTYRFVLIILFGFELNESFHFFHSIVLRCIEEWNVIIRILYYYFYLFMFLLQ
jgi:hypothetical protein